MYQAAQVSGVPDGVKEVRLTLCDEHISPEHREAVS